MKVIYPYVANYSRELEYSIKSLKNVKHDGVFIIGDKPDFKVPATILRPHSHKLPPTAYNDVLNKLKTATTEIESNKLLCMNDDFFIMKPYDFTMYDRGDILEHISERRRTDIYSKMLRDTHNYLKAHGYSIKDYTTHTPFLYERDKLKDLIKEILPTVTRGMNLSIRTLYGNVYQVPSKTIKDVKNPTNYKDLAIISTNEHTFMGELGLYIRSKLDDLN